MDERWPPWATQKIDVVEPDPAWPTTAQEFVGDLHERLSPWLDGSIEHIGSTAVRDLPAKPTVDLMAPVVSLTSCPAADSPLAEAGWQLVPPHLDARPWRRSYVLPDDDGAVRLAHLHFVEPCSPRWGQALAFREALRARPDLRAAYTEVKLTAAGALREDREGYTAAKSDFIERVLAEAGSHRDATVT